MANELRLQLEHPLELRIADFKTDQAKMQDVSEFVAEILDKAQIEAEIRQETANKNQPLLGLQNGSKKIGASINKARTSAKTFAARVLTAICNCTNSFKSVVNRN